MVALMFDASVGGGIPDTLGFITHIMPEKSEEQKMRSQSIISFRNILHLLDTEQFHPVMYGEFHQLYHATYQSDFCKEGRENDLCTNTQLLFLPL